MTEIVAEPGILVRYPPAEEETARRVAWAVERSVTAIRQLWDLPTPDVQVHVMTSWPGFLFGAAPWTWWVPMALTAPFWLGRVRGLWALAGGWNQAFGRKQRVGIKPPRLVRQAESEIGRRLYVAAESPAFKLENVVCHELTHAFTAHLKLAAWLNEGLAFVATDVFAGQPSIRQDTIELLRRSWDVGSLDTYRQVSPRDQDALLRHVTRGYWLTRYLHEAHPDLLDALLSERLPRQDVQDRIAEQLGIPRASFWDDADHLLVSYYAAP